MGLTCRDRRCRPSVRGGVGCRGCGEAEGDAADVFDDAVVAFGAGVAQTGLQGGDDGSCQASTVRAKLRISGTEQDAQKR